MGGVINIVTRKGARRRGARDGRGGQLRPAVDPRDAFRRRRPLDLFAWRQSAHSDGFPRYGYRIDRPIVLGSAFTGFFPLRHCRPTIRPTRAASPAASPTRSTRTDHRRRLLAVRRRAALRQPLRLRRLRRFQPLQPLAGAIGDGFARANVDSLGGTLRSPLTVFSTSPTATSGRRKALRPAYLLNYGIFNCRTGYLGARYGAEYQGDLKLGGFGDFALGARNETENACTSQSPDPDDGSFTPIDAAAYHQFDLRRARLRRSIGPI